MLCLVRENLSIVVQGALVFAGAFLGAIIGGRADGVINSQQLAHKRIAAACRRYELDLDRLNDLAQSYKPCIRKAVRRPSRRFR